MEIPENPEQRRARLTALAKARVNCLVSGKDVVPHSKANEAFNPPEPPEPPVLATESLEAGILALKGMGVHMAVLYATMLGYNSENNEENVLELIDLIQRSPDFTEDGTAQAVHRVMNDTDWMCRDQFFFESSVYGLGAAMSLKAERGDELMLGLLQAGRHGLDADKNLHLKPLLDPYRLAVAQFGAKSVFAAAEFDVAAFIKRTALEWREADLTAILSKLEEKRSYLAPLLMRAHARGRNKYGDVDNTELFNELIDFLKTYFNKENLRFFDSYYPLSLCLLFVDSWLVETKDALTIPIDGIDFEHWCAARIEEQGWQVRVSKATGDQGIDIEAMKDGKLVAIQCKRYNQPIGNKSVQEAYTGATHYRADRAVVIGTGGYTRAAIELAENTGVVLLDAENIAAFTALVLPAMPPSPAAP